MRAPKINLQRILFISLSLSLIVIYVLSWVDVITDPVQRTGSDFMAFYAAGRSALENTPAAAYDLAYIKANEEKVLGFRIANQDVSFFVHPPLVLPILWLIAHFDYLVAFYLWVGFLLILCALCAQVAVNLFQARKDVNRFVIWCGTFLFFPLFISLVNGDTSALLLLGVLILYYGVTQGSSQVAGLGLALTTISPQITLVLAIPFFCNTTYRKVWWWFCLDGMILASISMLMIGVKGVQNFLNLLTVTAGGHGYKINEIAMVNLIGLITRWFPKLDGDFIRIIGWVGSLAGLTILCWTWWKIPVIEDRHISLAVIIVAFTSPHLHYHDLALLVIPILIAIRTWTAAGKISLEYAALLPLGISIMWVFTYSIPQLSYAVVYLVEAALLGSIWVTHRAHQKSLTQ